MEKWGEPIAQCAEFTRYCCWCVGGGGIRGFHGNGSCIFAHLSHD